MYDKAKLLDRILKLLAGLPGLTAQECARELRSRGIDVDKAQVNSLLRSSADVIALGDSPPSWFLVEQLAHMPGHGRVTSDTQSATAAEILELLKPS